MNLYRADVNAMPRSDLVTGRALADVVALGILHERTLNQTATVNQQLQTALDTRLIIEQAKGVLAERGNVDMDRGISRCSA
ncbi:MAG: hypothetical protein QOK18_4884, partial [Mycobacterium sp.]|nr:hypothetical protein [Mycobacterium sp.]